MVSDAGATPKRSRLATARGPRRLSCPSIATAKSRDSRIRRLRTRHNWVTSSPKAARVRNASRNRCFATRSGVSKRPPIARRFGRYLPRSAIRVFDSRSCWSRSCGRRSFSKDWLEVRSANQETTHATWQTSFPQGAEHVGYRHPRRIAAAHWHVQHERHGVRGDACGRTRDSAALSLLVQRQRHPGALLEVLMRKSVARLSPLLFLSYL